MGIEHVPEWEELLPLMDTEDQITVTHMLSWNSFVDKLLEHE